MPEPICLNKSPQFPVKKESDGVCPENIDFITFEIHFSHAYMPGSDFAGDIPDQKSSWHAKGSVIELMVSKTFSLEYKDVVDRHGLRYISLFVICGFS